MLETVVTIILVPVALLSAVFTIGIGIGIVKAFKKK